MWQPHASKSLMKQTQCLTSLRFCLTSAQVFLSPWRDLLHIHLLGPLFRVFESHLLTDSCCFRSYKFLASSSHFYCRKISLVVLCYRSQVCYLIKIKDFIPQLHQSHFKSSVATWGFGYHTVTENSVGQCRSRSIHDQSNLAILQEY